MMTTYDRNETISLPKPVPCYGLWNTLGTSKTYYTISETKTNIIKLI